MITTCNSVIGFDMVSTVTSNDFNTDRGPGENYQDSKQANALMFLINRG
ncbi:hypothetical protein O9929_08505 [Vibrio lentus]|nr:hypothetical protein [Vibrio lentus]